MKSDMRFTSPRRVERRIAKAVLDVIANNICDYGTRVALRAPISLIPLRRANMLQNIFIFYDIINGGNQTLLITRFRIYSRCCISVSGVCFLIYIYFHFEGCGIKTM